jgi:hypothetical protein
MLLMEMGNEPKPNRTRILLTTEPNRTRTLKLLGTNRIEICSIANFAMCTSLLYVAHHLPKPETSITDGIGSKLKIETLTGPMMVPI